MTCKFIFIFLVAAVIIGQCRPYYWLVAAVIIGQWRPYYWPVTLRMHQEKTHPDEGKRKG